MLPEPLSFIFHAEAFPVKKKPIPTPPLRGYNAVFSSVLALLDGPSRILARVVNSIITATYWEIEGREVGRIRRRTDTGYLNTVWARFFRQNLQRFRRFYLFQLADKIRPTLSSKWPDETQSTELLESGDLPIHSTASKIWQTLSAKSSQLTLSDFATFSASSLMQTNRAFFGDLHHAPFQRTPCGGTFRFQPDGDN